MSGKDDPFGGRTVIIPNPGGAARRDSVEPLPPLSPPRGVSPPQDAGVFGTPPAEDWMSPRPQMRPPAAGGPPKAPPQPERRIPLEVALNASNTAEFSAATRSPRRRRRC